MDAFDRRLDKLDELYADIWQWGRKNYDAKLERRVLNAVNVSSKLAIVGQSHAKDQVRLSGVNWFNKLGQMGSTGRNLERILNCVGYSVRPRTEVNLGSHLVVQCSPKYQTVYTTDIFPCHHPDRKKPSPAMLKDAIRQRFLVRELDILQPNVILLLGTDSYHTFYRTVLNEAKPPNIMDVFASLSPATQLRNYHGATVVPFPHPSGSNGHFTPWLKNVGDAMCQQPQIMAIQRALSGVDGP